MYLNKWVHVGDTHSKHCKNGYKSTIGYQSWSLHRKTMQNILNLEWFFHFLSDLLFINKVLLEDMYTNKLIIPMHACSN
jgi:hypothetical protein